MKKKQKGAFVLFLKRALICLVMFIVLLLSSGGLFLWNLNSADNDSPSTIKYLLSATDGKKDDGTEQKLSNVSRDRLIRNGIYYLNMTELASLYSFTTTGDRTELRYITDLERDENVRVFINSASAVVNGTPVTLNAPCIRENGNVYIPLQFFIFYMTGLDIEFSEAENILKITRIVKDSPVGAKTYQSIAFTLKSEKVCASVPESQAS